MKFLCVDCDQAMKLDRTVAPEGGSLTVVFSCPSCSRETAMLTNPMETQMVSSLGVTIGPDGQEVEGASKCPFTGMVNEAATEPSDAGFPWSDEARERMASIPAFVKPMVESGIEKFARDHGYSEISAGVLEEAKGFFGME
jgi:hypothetical protein